MIGATTAALLAGRLNEVSGEGKENEVFFGEGRDVRIDANTVDLGVDAA